MVNNVCCYFCKKKIAKYNLDRFLGCDCGAHYIIASNFSNNDIIEIIKDYLSFISKFKRMAKILKTRLDIEINITDLKYDDICIVFLKFNKHRATSDFSRN